MIPFIWHTQNRYIYGSKQQIGGYQALVEMESDRYQIRGPSWGEDNVLEMEEVAAQHWEGTKYHSSVCM